MRIYFKLIAWTGMLAAGVALAAPVAVPATDAAALAFNQHREPLRFVEQLLPGIVALLMLFSGLAARLRVLCGRFSGGRYFLTLTLFACTYLFVAAVAALPAKFYADVLDLRIWDKPTGTAAEWLTGQTIDVAVKLVITALFIWIPYALIAKMPRQWWLYSASSLIPVAFFAIVAWPVWVAPLTSHYVPLADKTLLATILEMETRCGVPHIPVFIGGHEDTVVGLGPTNRIVLNQDIFRNETSDQIAFTVGHEMKHYLEGDNWKALLIVAGLLFAGFFLVDRIGLALIRRYSVRIGFTELADPASFPMAILVLSIGWLLVQPAFNAFARHIEHEADRFSLELTHRNDAMGAMFAGFSSHWGEDVEWDGFQRLFYATHPSNGERIRFANTYHPWAEGKPLTYTMCSHSQ